MTRFLLLLSLAASFAFSQTYIRPSKGVPIDPFPFNSVDGGTIAITVAPDGGSLAYCTGGWPGYPRLWDTEGPGATQACSKAYDWSAFVGMSLRIYSDSSSLNYRLTNVCSGITPVTLKLADLGSVVRVRVEASGGDVILSVDDAASYAGPFARVYTTTASARTTYPWGTAPDGGDWVDVAESDSLGAFLGCAVKFQLIPLPFAPSQLSNAASTSTSVTLPDGGIIVNVSVPAITTVSTSPYTCGTASVHSTVYMDGGTQIIGTIAGIYTVICNAKSNTGTSTVRCRGDGVVPLLDAGAPGTELGVGDCVPYTNNAAVAFQMQCIAPTNYVNVYECAP